MIEMKHFLITGANGFIGRQLCRRLHTGNNIGIKAITRQEVEGPWDQTCLCDFAQGGIPAEEMAGVDTVFHLAGIAHDFRTGPDIATLYRTVNTAATVQLASLAAAHAPYGICVAMLKSEVKKRQKLCH